MRHKCAFSGSGGQGSALMAKLLCLGAIRRSYNVVMTQTYGIEQRGGDSTGYVVLSDRPIGNPIVEDDADIAVALSRNVYPGALQGTIRGGTLFVNSSLIDAMQEAAGVHQIQVPATETAIAIGSVRCANMVMLGAVLARTRILSYDDIAAALKDEMGEKSSDLLELNLQALQEGMALTAAAAD